MQARLKKVAEENYEEFTFDESTDRVRCAGHKIALTVNGGLQALGIEAPPPPLVKSTILGNFPLDEHTLATIPEEEEDGEESSKSQQTPLNNQDNSDYKDEDTDLSNLPGKEVSNEWYQVIDGPFDPPPAVEVEQPATNRNEANEVHALTLKGIL
ncbi:uncharacterized protein MELLADRAFT_55625 [Melampsora larici-populina 98AG31]|uniref:Uncharacterized protein n=1 Tax=Melampsora larici-populina (strain 98AG31 / pathotype 3-4-7) TaxID=747676 RepID=F4RGX0_MELLP|nr:uncharacterized protein MELLADRAFT_55625 [Melampsora larici-populina 98AG31]EGG08125.1 hypothetical protein MELLADRAFT_55625 [Melampsora larici-populina 98AG31]